MIDSRFFRAFKDDFNLSKKTKTMYYSDGKFPNTEIEDNGFLNPMELISRPTDENCGTSSKAYSIGYHWVFRHRKWMKFLRVQFFSKILRQLYDSRLYSHTVVCTNATFIRESQRSYRKELWRSERIAGTYKYLSYMH